jgi:hypothetical protein
MSGVLKVANVAVQVVAGLGVSKVINDVIVNNTNVITQADAVKVAAGSLVLGSMVVDASTAHVNDRITALANWFSKRKTESTLEEVVA